MEKTWHRVIFLPSFYSPPNPWIHRQRETKYRTNDCRPKNWRWISQGRLTYLLSLPLVRVRGRIPLKRYKERAKCCSVTRTAPSRAPCPPKAKTSAQVRQYKMWKGEQKPRMPSPLPPVPVASLGWREGANTQPCGLQEQDRTWFSHRHFPHSLAALRLQVTKCSEGDVLLRGLHVIIKPCYQMKDK